MAIGKLAIFLLTLTTVYCFPEDGISQFKMSYKNSFEALVKKVYNNTVFSFSIHCTKGTGPIKIQWILRGTNCAKEYEVLFSGPEIAMGLFDSPDTRLPGFDSNPAWYNKSKVYEDKCTPGTMITIHDIDYTIFKDIPPRQISNKTVEASQDQTQNKKDDSADKNTENDADGAKAKGNSRRKRDDTAANEVVTPTPTATTTKDPKSGVRAGLHRAPNTYQIAKTDRDGVYLLELQVITVEGDGIELDVSLHTFGPHGYLSAIDWPLLPFYGVMCFVYLAYGIAWLILAALNWRDLLQIQIWIGAVIFLGMLEKAVFFGEYEHINSSGIPTAGASIFAELISCLKRSLARILIIIVSLGFGIVKPRLGPMLQKVVAVGFLYFALASIEGIIRVWGAKTELSNKRTFAAVPLAVLDAGICWWIFSSLVQTTRTLRLRRNIVKLSLYRHFTNTLIFAILASVIFMIWFIKQYQLSACMGDWKEIWVEEAFWRILFSVVLLVIIILWRPNANNQRYAFTPLLDQDEEDEEHNRPVNDAFDGMKLRQTDSNGPTPTKRGEKLDEDMKWIEENIPSSIADTALPSLLDSDEEIVTTKYEMSKME